MLSDAAMMRPGPRPCPLCADPSRSQALPDLPVPAPARDSCLTPPPEKRASAAWRDGEPW